MSSFASLTIFDNDHFPARKEVGQVRGRKSGPTWGREAKKRRLEISHLKPKQGQQEKWVSLFSKGVAQFSGWSKCGIASVESASMDMTPVVWRLKEDTEELTTLRSMSRSGHAAKRSTTADAITSREHN